MLKELKPAFLMMLVMTVLTGLLYPAVITGVSQVLFRDQANGSLIVKDGQVIGSRLIGQNFTKDEISICGPRRCSGYDPTATAGSNLGPTSEAVQRHDQDGRQDGRKRSTLTVSRIASSTTASTTVPAESPSVALDKPQGRQGNLTMS